MLDPVANTLDLREPFDDVRAKRVLAAVDDTGVAIADVAYFDDMLHEDPAIRRKKHDFMIRRWTPPCCSASAAVTGFVGRDQSKSMDQNLIEFENSFVPLLQEAKARGLQYRVEQCPMPGLDARRQLPQQHRLRARACGSRCTRSASATASATSSASTTTRRTPS